jgi:hypothetical protein
MALEVEYEIGRIVDAAEVPNWARREPKWKSLIEAVSKVLPGQSLLVTFSSHKEANRVRNTVRDKINLQVGQAVIRTRVVDRPDYKADVYFTRLFPEEIVEEKRDIE